MSGRVEWTDDMIAAFLDMRANQRMPLYQCAEKIGVAYETAVLKARELGVAHRMNRGRTPGRVLAERAA